MGKNGDQAYIDFRVLPTVAWHVSQLRHSREPQKPKRLCDPYQIQLFDPENIRSLMFRICLDKRYECLGALKTEGTERRYE